MVEIPVDEAINRLMDARPGLYADFAADLRDEDTKLKSQAYLCHRAVLVRTVWKPGVWIWYVCDTGASDMDAARRKLSEDNGEGLDIVMIHAGELEGTHCLVLSGIGKEYHDPDIRAIRENHRTQFSVLTDAADDGNPFAESIAHALNEDFSAMIADPRIHILGIFANETLAGAVSVKSKNRNDVIAVSHVFVSRNYRGRGYATRLIRAAMALYPGVRYMYSCGTDNRPSLSAALSAGFQLEGTYDF